MPPYGLLPDFCGICSGAIKAINESKQTITINVELFGRETPVELGFAEVKKM